MMVTTCATEKRLTATSCAELGNAHAPLKPLSWQSSMTLMLDSAMECTDQAPCFALRSLEPEGAPRLFALPLGPTTIGAGATCDLRLEHDGVRPLHCLIIRSNDQMTVRRWSEGTQLNGQTFTEAPLVEGDNLSLGPIELNLVREASSLELSSTNQEREESPADPCEAGEFTTSSRNLAPPAPPHLQDETPCATIAEDEESSLGFSEVIVVVDGWEATPQDILFQDGKSSPDEDWIRPTEISELVMEVSDASLTGGEEVPPSLESDDHWKIGSKNLRRRIRRLLTALRSERCRADQIAEQLSEASEATESVVHQLEEITQQQSRQVTETERLQGEARLAAERAETFRIERDQISTELEQLQAEAAGLHEQSEVFSASHQERDRERRSLQAEIESLESQLEASREMLQEAQSNFEGAACPIPVAVPAKESSPSAREEDSCGNTMEEEEKALDPTSSGEPRVRSPFKAPRDEMYDPSGDVKSLEVDSTSPSDRYSQVKENREFPDDLWDIELQQGEPSADSSESQSGGSDGSEVSDWIKEFQCKAVQPHSSPLAQLTGTQVPSCEVASPESPVHEEWPPKACKAPNEIECDSIPSSPSAEDLIPESQPSSEAPASFLDQYSHLLKDEPEEAPVPLCQSEKPIPAPPTTEQETEEDSINDYMAQLLQRVQGKGIAEPSEIVPCKEPATSEPVVQAPLPTAPAKPQLIDMEELKGKPAPEQATDMGLLRELANSSARHAVVVAASKESKEKALVNLIVSIMALACGVYLIISSVSFFSMQLSVGVGALGWAAYWGYSTLKGVPQTFPGDGAVEKLPRKIVDQNPRTAQMSS